MRVELLTNISLLQGGKTLPPQPTMTEESPATKTAAESVSKDHPEDLPTGLDGKQQYIPPHLASPQGDILGLDKSGRKLVSKNSSGEPPQIPPLPLDIEEDVENSADDVVDDSGKNSQNPVSLETRDEESSQEVFQREDVEDDEDDSDYGESPIVTQCLIAPPFARPLS